MNMNFCKECGKNGKISYARTFYIAHMNKMHGIGKICLFCFHVEIDYERIRKITSKK